MIIIPLTTLYIMSTILFFDIETSGLPPMNIQPSEKTFGKYDKCRIVSIAWTLRDKCVTYSQNYCIVDPGEDYNEKEIGAEFIHGISRELVDKYGKPIDQVLKLFMRDVRAADRLVAHNISFDKSITIAELYRIDDKESALVLHNHDSLCTMKTTTDIVKIPSRSGYSAYKWPKLQELHEFLFGVGFDDGHNAQADVDALVRCYYKIEKDI